MIALHIIRDFGLALTRLKSIFTGGCVRVCRIVVLRYFCWGFVAVCTCILSCGIAALQD